MQNLNCFLLSYLKYGEQDAVLHCFSVEEGYQSFFLKNVYSPRSKKKAYLYPLSQMQISFIDGRSNLMGVISKIELTKDAVYVEDVKFGTVMLFVADFLNQILKKETDTLRIYLEIEKLVSEINSKNNDAYIAFVFRILLCQGLSPLVSSERFLEPYSGEFSPNQSHDLFDEDVSQIWKNYLSNDDTYNFKLKRSVRKKVLESLMLYYSIHFSNFYKPNSLEIMNQIYE